MARATLLTPTLRWGVNRQPWNCSNAWFDLLSGWPLPPCIDYQSSARCVPPPLNMINQSYRADRILYHPVYYPLLLEREKFPPFTSNPGDFSILSLRLILILLRKYQIMLSKKLDQLLFISLVVLALMLLWRVWAFIIVPALHPREPKELPYSYWLSCKCTRRSSLSDSTDLLCYRLR